MKKNVKHVAYLKRRRVVTDMLTAALKDNKSDDLSVPMFSLAEVLKEKTMATSH